MKKILEEIQDGTFASKWIAENNNGRAHFNAKRALEASHQLEEVGKELRKMYSWSTKRKICKRTKRIRSGSRAKAREFFSRACAL